MYYLKFTQKWARAAMMLLVAVLCSAGARAQQTLPYSYGFENNNLATDGWTTQNPSGLDDSKFLISNSARTGDYGFQFSSYSDQGDHTQYLISPELNAPNGVTAQFYYKASSTSGTELFKVGYSTTDTDISNFTFGDEISTNSTDWTLSEEFIFPAGTKYVAIYYYSNYQYYLYVDDFTFEASSPCAKPTNLAVTTDGQTATVTWDGTADNNFIVTVNGGTPVTGQTSPYTFNVALSTTYEVVVVADYGALGTSNPVSTSFTTPDCLGGHVITYALSDSYGDGWNGNAINVVDECGNLIETLTIASGSSNNGTLSLCGDYYQFTWTVGSYASEASFTLLDNGVAIYSNQAGGSLTDGQVLYTIGTNTRIPKPTALTAGEPEFDNVDLSWTENGTATAWEICINGDESNLVSANTNENFNLTGLQPDNSYSIKVRAVEGNYYSCWSQVVTVTTPVTCARPTDLTEANITFTTADLSWTGTSESYVVEYGTWTQVGTDQTATGTMTSYPFDLSGFSGKGTIAIRHYNVNDQFYLNVDDIVVKDANGNIVFSENFESGSIPANMSNIDLDGDGYEWNIGSAGQLNSNGSYCVYSASWLDGTILYPDNWLVISDITLGGSITINACGQDASAAAENFGVYVIADNQFTQAYSGTATSCQVTGLTEGTAYAWRVQGDCGQYQSNWVFSMFKTPDDLLIFANEGNWDDLSNWTDIDGNAATALPTATNKVRIDADAFISDGVVATAKNVTLNGGTIEVEEGGQLKQGGSVKVTMHKGIKGYVDGNDQYYLIATPHNCSWLEQNTTFPYVLNLTGDEYDLYAFDATADLEWINFENNSSHSEFHQGSNTGLFNKKGYLYANAEDTDLTFEGTVSSSLNSTLTESYTYSATSTNAFNGWKLIGNPFTCNAYVYYTDEEDNQLPATFYKMNAEGDGLEEVTGMIELAPFEGAFIVVNASGKIVYSSELVDVDDSGESVAKLPILFGHGLDSNQDANENIASITFAPEGYGTFYYGEYDAVLPNGMKAYVVTAHESEQGTTTGTPTYAEIADGDGESNIVPAATAVLLQVAPSDGVQTIDIDLVAPSAGAISGTNYLYGSDTETTTTGGDKFYKLTYKNGEELGWYWGEEGGLAFTSGAHKAWLALPADGARFFGLPGFDVDNTTTAVNSIEDGKLKIEDDWYSVDGRKLDKQPTRKGVYLNNGRKVVIK